MILHESASHAEVEVANLIVDRINTFQPTVFRQFVLVLAADKVMIGVYRALERMCQDGKVSFENVVVVGMDEYVGVSSAHPCSKCHFIHEEFLEGTDFVPAQTIFLSGIMDPEQECASFESQLMARGGVNLVVATLGEHGALGMNFPGQSLGSRTRMVQLLPDGVPATAFPQEPPTHALTIGLGPIMEADEVVVLGTGSTIAPSLKRILEEGVTQMCPASVLQFHPDAKVWADTGAASLLSDRTKALLSAPSPPAPTSRPTYSLASPSSRGAITPPGSALPPIRALPFVQAPDPLPPPAIVESSLEESWAYTARSRFPPGERQALRVVTGVTGIVASSPLAAKSDLASLGASLYEIQEGEEDDAGPGW